MHFKIIVLAITGAACVSCINSPSPKPPAPKQSGETLPVGKGTVRVTVRNIKSEKQAWFQNCLSFNISGQKDTVVVGCNKRKPNTQFLEVETPRDFSVSKGENVLLSFFFDTWYSTSSCITWDACTNPYPNPPVKSPISKSSASIICYKSKSGQYRLFYEDQPAESFQADASVRSRLNLSGTAATASIFDPAHPANDAVYQLKPGSSLNPQNFLEKCIIDSTKGQEKISESVLQKCIGIDHLDLVVDVTSTDAAIAIEGISDENCSPI